MLKWSGRALKHQLLHSFFTYTLKKILFSNVQLQKKPFKDIFAVLYTFKEQHLAYSWGLDIGHEYI